MAGIAEWVENFAKYTIVSVTVDAEATEGSSAANASLVGWTVYHKYLVDEETKVNDALIDEAVVWVDGSVTVTLKEAAVEETTVFVIVAVA
jgi:hypothetical protein